MSPQVREPPLESIQGKGEQKGRLIAVVVPLAEADSEKLATDVAP